MKNRHLSDEELLWAIDDEVPAGRAAGVQAHLADCGSCRVRRDEIVRAIGNFSRLNEDVALTPAHPGRALLRARMEELEAGPGGPARTWGFALLLGALAASVMAILFVWPREGNIEARLVPDPRLTPGATLPLTREQVCAVNVEDNVREISSDVAMAVFAAYGIHEPRPRAYEMDYLISPALGGSDNYRNFWPQSYRNTVWNAHVKDALEDHLHRLVCSGELDLATAQRDIARDWIAAYKKYFRTDSPLEEHARFLLDRPWE